MKHYVSMMWIACSAILGCFALGCGAEDPAAHPPAPTEASHETVNLAGSRQIDPLARTDVRLVPAGAAYIAATPTRRVHLMSAEHAAQVHPYVERPRGEDTGIMTMHSSQP